MKRAATKTTAFVATAAAIGFTSLFGVVSPANAAPAACTQGVVLPSSTICELKFTASGTFTPSVDMGQLEVLLVGGGGSGAASEYGYGAGAGGGGEVKVVGFGGDTSTPLNLVVGGAGQASTATQGATVASAAPGTNGTFGTISVSPVGGSSGNGNPGSTASNAGGGGAGASPVSSSSHNGGAGVTAASAGGSLFNGDTSCYGGGGAAGGYYNGIGTASCGGGSVVLGTGDVDPVAAAPNSGGGGGGGGSATDATSTALRAGASGLIVLRWNPLGDVTVSFDGNGHGGAVAAQTFVSGGTVSKPADPTAAGFVFNGWFTDAALTSPVDFAAAVTASTTYFASWTAVAPATVTVSFDSNGHGAAVAPQTFVSGGTVAKPADPIAVGFIFNGWFTDAALTSPVVFSAPVTASTTFYAKWTAVAPEVETVTVTFNNGGHGGSVAPQSFDKGGMVSAPAALSASGFVFNGWYSDAALTKKADFGTAITASTTFFASWSAVVAPDPVTVTFAMNGQGGTVVSQTVAPGGTITPPADPIAQGFIFNGWYSDAALTKKADFSAPITAETTFYASWTAVTPTPTPTPTPAPTPAPSATSAPAQPAAPLASTGAAISPAAVPLSLAALGLGAWLLALRGRRARRTN